MPFHLLRKETWPPGGWRMPTPHGMIEAKSPAELAQKLADYRRANLIEIGDTEQAVEDYFCTQFPDQCHGSHGMTAPQDRARGVEGGLGARATAWIVEAYQRGYGAEHVDAETTLRRERVCRGCEAHRPEQKLGCCGLPAEDAQRLQFLVRKGRETDLGLCELFGLDAGSAAFLPIKFLPSAAGQMPAAGCWIERERKETNV